MLKILLLLLVLITWINVYPLINLLDDFDKIYDVDGIKILFSISLLIIFLIIAVCLQEVLYDIPNDYHSYNYCIGRSRYQRSARL